MNFLKFERTYTNIVRRNAKISSASQTSPYAALISSRDVNCSLYNEIYISPVTCD